METTYAYSAWFFSRALSLIFLVAFLSLLPQAKGLWGKHGVLPMSTYMKSMEQKVDNSRYWTMPSAFWLSTSDDFIVGAAVTGAVAAGLALIGFAQGWSLLMCVWLYLSFCNSGQDFMSFQWDALLIELGVLALFVVPWRFDFTLGNATEPHWFVRTTFYIVLFKLMFFSGIVKLASGDESWRDLSALSYHYLTQPLPNPLSPFAHALPDWIHSLSTLATLLIELIAPFFIFWPRTRMWTGLSFIVLSGIILLTGNFTFFNYLTIALCFWLIPDTFWQRIVEILPFHLEVSPAAIFPHPVVAVMMGTLASLSFVWCVRLILPDVVTNIFRPVLGLAQSFHVSNSYGLFANMTKTRPEIVIEGSEDGNTWKEYEFKFKPGPMSRPPPWIAPFQPRLDWQMWFAALAPAEQSPWIKILLQRLFENAPEVTEFFSTNPFAEKAPQFLRTKLFRYEFSEPDEIINNDLWWKRTLIGDYTLTFKRP